MRTKRTRALAEKALKLVVLYRWGCGWVLEFSPLKESNFLGNLLLKISQAQAGRGKVVRGPKGSSEHLQVPCVGVGGASGP